MEKIWRLVPKINSDFQKSFPEIQPLILQLLFNLGLTKQEKINEFFFPNYPQDLHEPFLFSEMKKGVERVLQSVKKKEKITIYGDYDADGVTGTAVLFLSLKKIGALVETYLPDREKEGYGLNQEAIKQLAKKGTRLLITVDCGITNLPEIKLAQQLNVEVIVTDHHLPPKKLPPAFAILNPKIDGEKYPFKDLAGVGVAFKLAQGLLKKKSINSVFEKWLLDLVAIGTIADLVPLLGENRILVKYGLIVLNKTPRLGLKALIEKAGLTLGNLNNWHVNYQIAPRLNAVGRINHARTALDLILTESKKEAERLAESVNQINQERQKIVEVLFKKIREKFDGKIKDKIIFFYQEFCPAGILGLLASKMVEIYHRPALVISHWGDKIRGVGRSIEQFNLIQVLQKLEDFFLQYGGHSGAAGFTFKEKNLSHLENFFEKIKKIANHQLKEEDLKPIINISAETDLSEINWSFYKELEKFEPFGQGNPVPTFLAKDLIIKEKQTVGKANQHLKIKVNGNRTMIYFNTGEIINNLKKGDKVDVVFEIRSHEWNGVKELELVIIDLKKV